jgi:hypothetical protein
LAKAPGLRGSGAREFQRRRGRRPDKDHSAGEKAARSPLVLPVPRKPSPKQAPVPIPPAESGLVLGNSEEQKCVTKADQFVRQLQNQPWCEEMFPHME